MEYDFTKMNKTQLAKAIGKAYSFVSDMQGRGLKFKDKKASLPDAIKFYNQILVEKEIKKLDNKHKREIEVYENKLEKSLKKLNDIDVESKDDDDVKKLKLELLKLDKVMKKASISKANVVKLKEQTNLIKEFSLLCNKEDMEQHFRNILITLKESLLASSHHMSHKLKDKSQSEIKTMLSREYEAILISASSIKYESNNDNQKAIDDILDDMDED